MQNRKKEKKRERQNNNNKKSPFSFLAHITVKEINLLPNSFEYIR